MALRFVITTDASGAITGVKQLGEAADDAGKKLDNLGEKGKTSGKDIEGGLDGVSSKAKQAGADISEGLAGGFGIAGIAAGAVVTAILAQLSQTQAALDETRAAAGELAKELYASGGEDLPLQVKVEKLFDTLSKEVRPNGPLQQLIDQYVDFGTVVDRIGDVSKGVDIPVKALTAALSGDDLEKSKATLKIVNAELERMKRSSNGITTVWDRQPLEDYKTSLQGVVDQYRIAEQLNTPEIMRAGKVDELAQSWRDATTAVSDYFSPDQAGFEAFDITRYLADMEDQVLRANELKADLLTVPEGIAAQAQEVWATQGVLAADKYVDGYQNASEGDKARLESVAASLGTGMGTQQSSALLAAFEAILGAWTPEPIPVKLIPDDAQIRAWSPPMKTGYVTYVQDNPFQAALDAKYGPN